MDAAPDPLVGQTLEGRYLVHALLGKGGMGRVYEAEETRLRRRCALKVLRGEFAEERAHVDRFLREAQAIAQLSHPHIVDIYSYGEDPSGAVFFAMELLVGEDLEARLRDRKRPVGWREVCHWAVQIARAVAAVHAAGLVHRDLKPGNVFLARRRDGSEIVKLLDFGIVRSEESELTRTGATLGTPHYMSPEQIRSHTLDGRSDVYAFGVLLFRALAGRLPFRGDAFQVAIMHVETAPPGLLETANDPALPPALAAIVERALQKPLADRYQSMEEIERALLEVLQAEDPMLLPGPRPTPPPADPEQDPPTTPRPANASRSEAVNPSADRSEPANPSQSATAHPNKSEPANSSARISETAHSSANKTELASSSANKSATAHPNASQSAAAHPNASQSPTAHPNASQSPTAHPNASKSATVAADASASRSAPAAASAARRERDASDSASSLAAAASVPAPATMPELSARALLDEPRTGSRGRLVFAALASLAVIGALLFALRGPGDDAPASAPSVAAAPSAAPSAPVPADPTPVAPEPPREPAAPEPAPPEPPPPSAPSAGRSSAARKDPPRVDPLKQIARRAKDCRRKYAATTGPAIAIDYAVGSDGRVTRSVPAQSDELGKCLADAVRQTTFPPRLALGQKLSL